MAADFAPKNIKSQIYYSRDIDQLCRVWYAEEIKSTTEELDKSNIPSRG